MHDSVHITLIHGTFARNAAWTRTGSMLRTSLTANVRGDVQFHEFKWLGLPSHWARHIAATRLRLLLKGSIQDDPDGRHFVIAHSHGGNIALYAMRDSQLADRIDGVVTLSTPFLVPHRRQLSIFGKLSLGWTSVAAYCLALTALYWEFPRVFQPPSLGSEAGFWHYSLYYAVLLISRIAGVVAACSLLGLFAALGVVSRRAVAWFLSTLALPRLRADKLLIVRGPKDEANALLVGIQLLQLFITSIWGRRGRLDSKLRSVVAFTIKARRWVDSSRSDPPWYFLYAYFIWMISALVLALLSIIGSFFPSIHSTLYVLFVTWMIINVPIIIPLTIVCASAIVGTIFVATVGVVLGSLVNLAVVCLAGLMLATVPEIGLLCVFVEVSTEPSPPGTFSITQIGGPIRGAKKLMHSISYDDEEAVKTIVQWINDNQCETRGEKGAPKTG